MAEELKLKRLCSEIQLFDLCSKDECEHKDGRYCGNIGMVAKFEAINEPDEHLQDQFITDEEDELADYDDMEPEDGCDDDFDREYNDDEE